MSPCPTAVLCPGQTMGEMLHRDTVLAVTRPCAPRRYDDYDYAEVNQLLERMLKVYIKTVTCYPEKTNPEMFDRFWKQFKHSEKVGQSAPGSDWLWWGWEWAGAAGWGDSWGVQETIEPPSQSKAAGLHGGGKDSCLCWKNWWHFVSCQKTH